MTFGEHVKRLRTERGMTQRALSEAAGVDFTYLSKIENDRLPYSPSVKTLQALARVLAVDELDLMRLADKVPPALEAIASNAEAMRFFRRASESVKSSEEWRELLGFLESRVKER